MAATMKKVAATICEIAGFVTDIENIGSEIDLIALNSQIKAAHTGTEGAALGVLAEAIKRLSVDAVTQTEAVSRTLLQINTVTDQLINESLEETEQLGAKVTVMEDELDGILGALESMNADLAALLSGLHDRVSGLTHDIDQATGGIDVHVRVRQLSDDVVASLDRIVETARQIEPASTEFKDNLRHMEERYTMQSERHIHEAIARKRGHTATLAVQGRSMQDKEPASADESEFGANVDLF
jgi:methyl-accepting chemotaxis protein